MGGCSALLPVFLGLLKRGSIVSLKTVNEFDAGAECLAQLYRDYVLMKNTFVWQKWSTSNLPSSIPENKSYTTLSL